MDKLKSKGCASGLVLAFVFVLCSSVAQAQGYVSRVRNMETDRAYRQLLDAHIFNLGGVGFVLSITPEEKAFQVLLRSANSVALFERLISEGNPEGQLFALYGLYLEKPRLFENEVERFKREAGPGERWEGMIFIEKGKIRTGVGCILFRQERQTIISKIANGEFDKAYQASSLRLVDR